MGDSAMAEKQQRPAQLTSVVLLCGGDYLVCKHTAVTRKKNSTHCF
jgi:hypothetical protein